MFVCFFFSKIKLLSKLLSSYNVICFFVSFAVFKCFENLFLRFRFCFTLLCKLAPSIKVIEYVCFSFCSGSVIENYIQKLSKTKSVRTGKIERKEAKTFNHRSLYQCFAEVIFDYFFILIENVFADFLRTQFVFMYLVGKMVRGE